MTTGWPTGGGPGLTGNPPASRSPSSVRAPKERRLRRYLRRPPGHWLLFAVLMTALLLALLLEGFAGQQLGSSSTRGQGPPVAGLAGAGPVLDLSRSGVRSVQAPPLEVALTFDDGPDPKWTTRILEVLRRHRVRATFFVVGSKIRAHPATLRAILGDGHEVGSHTFTHADLGRVSGLQANFELTLTETALAGAA